MSIMNQTSPSDELSPAMLELWERSRQEDRNLGTVLGVMVFGGGLMWLTQLFEDTLLRHSNQPFWLFILAIMVAFLGIYMARRVSIPKTMNTTRLITARPSIIRALGGGASAGAGFSVVNALSATGGLNNATPEIILVLLFAVVGYYCFRKADVIETLQKSLFAAHQLDASSAIRVP